MQFIKLGDELINLEVVARIELEYGLNRDQVLMEFNVRQSTEGLLGTGTDATSRLEYHNFWGGNVAALRWFFTEWLLYNSFVTPCFDVLKTFEAKQEQERIARREFRVGDEVCVAGRDKSYLIHALDYDSAALADKETGKPLFGDEGGAKLSDLSFADD